MSSNRPHTQRSASSSSRSSHAGRGRWEDTVPPGPRVSYRNISPASFVQPTSTTSRLGSMSRTSSSDPGLYASPTSFQTTSETQSSQPISPNPAATETTLNPISIPWSGPEFSHPTQWTHSENFIDYTHSRFPDDQLTGWDQLPADAPWNYDQPSPGPYQPGLAGSSISQTSRSSLVGYRPHRLATSQPISYPSLDTSVEVNYPVVYPSARTPSPKPQRRVSPVQSNVADVESLERVVNQQHPPSEDAEPASTSEIRQALADSRLRKGARSTVQRQSLRPNSTLTKIAKSQKQGRIGPLSVAQRQKADDMRYFGACWRCRKYKKPCNGPGVCDTCVTSGFRVWPSALGCRRGDLDNFAFAVIPTHAENVLVGLHIGYQRPSTWRQAPRIYRSDRLIPATAAQGDKWDQLLLKVQYTQIHGPGILELLEIAAQFQRSLDKENRVIANSVKALSLIIDLYRVFIATDDPLILESSSDLTSLLTQTRKVLISALNSFLNACLTGRLKDWLPSFLTGNILTFSYILIGDAVAAVPPQFRDKVWQNIRGIILELREQLYPMAQDLLSALGKGSRLLHMRCWEMVEMDDPSTENAGETGNKRWQRNKEGMRMMDDDTAAFDGLKALQLWSERFGPMMRGDVWYSNAPFTVDILPIASLERMFDFSPRG